MKLFTNVNDVSTIPFFSKLYSRMSPKNTVIPD